MRRFMAAVLQSSSRGAFRGCNMPKASSGMRVCEPCRNRFLTGAALMVDRFLTGAALMGAALIVAACTAMLGGCSYSTERPFSREFQTIHVEMLDSREFRRELEFRLTEALVKRIEMDTPYRIAERETADVLLTGEILSVGNRTFGTDFETGLPREIGSSVALRFQVKDLRTGAILVDRPRFVYQTHYIPPVGESFDKGMVRGLDGLAEAMVETMETPW